jgi:hypothetical protein
MSEPRGYPAGGGRGEVPEIMTLRVDVVSERPAFAVPVVLLLRLDTSHVSQLN